MENQFDILNALLLNNYGIYDYCFQCDEYESNVILKGSSYHIKFYNHIKSPSHFVIKDMIIKNNLSIDWEDQTLSFFEETSVRQIAINMGSEDKRIIYGKFYVVPKATIPGKFFIRFLDVVRLNTTNILLQPYFGG